MRFHNAKLRRKEFPTDKCWSILQQQSDLESKTSRFFLNLRSMQNCRRSDQRDRLQFDFLSEVANMCGFHMLMGTQQWQWRTQQQHHQQNHHQQNHHQQQQRQQRWETINISSNNNNNNSNNNNNNHNHNQLPPPPPPPPATTTTTTPPAAAAATTTTTCFFVSQAWYQSPWAFPQYIRTFSS